jgi:hypothetical protein
LTFFPLPKWAATFARVFGVALLLGAFQPPADAVDAPQKSQSILVDAAPIGFDRDNPEQRRFGKLEWLGTLRLSSPEKRFGGFSGIAIDAEGTKLLLISDQATWLQADIVTRAGRLDGLANARFGRIRGLGGKYLRKKLNKDSEDIAMAAPGALAGKAFIAFERNHRIAVHHVTSDGVSPAKRLLKLPARARSAKGNKGIEGLTVLRAGPLKGALVAFTEEYLDKQGNHIGWIVGGPRPGQITLKRLKGFSVTGLASLPNGELVVLERRFRYSEGVKMRLRRVTASQIRRGAVLKGEVLFETNQLREIDNMEGIAAHVDGQGRTILTLISDNNFNNIFQQTLLMQFAILD